MLSPDSCRYRKAIYTNFLDLTKIYMGDDTVSEVENDDGTMSFPTVKNWQDYGQDKKYVNSEHICRSCLIKRIIIRDKLALY